MADDKDNSGYNDFIDSTGEWRRLFAEFLGTFFLVLVSAGIKMVAKESGEISKAMEAVAPGLMVMVVIYSMGAVSGAHINPGVTLAFALRRHFPWKRVPFYIIIQIFGGITAVLLLKLLLGNIADFGATVPGPDTGNMEAVIFEVILTLGLVITILGTASGPRNVGSNGALAIGGYIALAGLWALPLTGASMNIARSLAPDLVRGNFETTFIYIFGSLSGAIIAVGCEWLLKGKPSEKADTEAQGSSEAKDEK